MSTLPTVNSPHGTSRIANISAYTKPYNHYSPPIDFYYTGIRDLVSSSSAISQAHENLMPLLIVGLISRTENYFRQILTAVLYLCPESKTFASEKSVGLGSIFWGEGALVKNSLFENVSFVEKKTIKGTLKSYIGLDVAENSEVSIALSEFEIICQMRHAVVHSAAIIAGKNAISAGIPSSGNGISLVFTPIEIAEIASICSSLVRATNKQIFEVIVKRWATSWRTHNTWNPLTKEKLFKEIWNTFRSKFDVEHNSLAKLSCAKAMKMVEAQYRC